MFVYYESNGAVHTMACCRFAHLDDAGAKVIEIPGIIPEDSPANYRVDGKRMVRIPETEIAARVEAEKAAATAANIEKMVADLTAAGYTIAKKG